MDIVVAKAFAAALAVGITGMSAAYAQARIGSAGAGAIAEKPEVAGMIIALEALPEILVILGFVVAAMIITQLK